MATLWLATKASHQLKDTICTKDVSARERLWLLQHTLIYCAQEMREEFNGVHHQVLLTDIHVIRLILLNGFGVSTLNKTEKVPLMPLHDFRVRTTPCESTLITQTCVFRTQYKQ